MKKHPHKQMLMGMDKLSERSDETRLHLRSQSSCTEERGHA